MDLVYFFFNGIEMKIILNKRGGIEMDANCPKPTAFPSLINNIFY